LDNQHRQIKGYKELDQAQIHLMNKIKEKGAEVGALVDELKNLRVNSALDQRWVSIGATHLQEGFMALTRSVAKPDFF
jgi:predicted nuclease with TOPRIM domain